MVAYAATGVLFSVHSLAIGSVTDNRADYAGSNIPAWSKLEVQFAITDTNASNLFTPYDASPPFGIAVGQGITVNVEFSDDDYVTSTVMPAYYEKVMTEAAHSSRDWMYPSGTERWVCRFAPPNAGDWQYRIRATDRDGTVVSDVTDVTVVNSDARGHVRVATEDPRYFEYADGSLMWPVGFNANETGDNNADVTSIDMDDGETGNDDFFAACQTNGINFLRHFQASWAIWGMNSNIWRTHDSTDRDGIVMLANESQTADVGSGSEAVWKLTNNGATGLRVLMTGWLRRNIAVKPSTVYRVRVRYRIPTTLVADDANPAGLCVKLSGTWLNTPYATGDGTPLKDGTDGTSGTAVRKLTATGTWDTLTCYFVTGGTDRWIGGAAGYFYITLENVDTASGGQVVYIDNIKIEEDIGGGSYTDICPKGDADMHLYVDHYRARVFDRMLEQAETNDVTLKLVVADRGDTILRTFDPTGAIEAQADSNFYGGDGGAGVVTRVRWLQQAWWRYVQARWGYSSAVHTWELTNEADPFSTAHFDLLEQMAQFLSQFGNRHLVTTSTFHSFVRFCWNRAPTADYHDVHNYVQDPDQFVGNQTIRTDLLSVDGSDATSIITNIDGATSDFYDLAANITRFGSQIGTNGSQGLGKPVMRGETGLFETSTDFATDQIDTDTDRVWLHKMLWGQLDPSGFMDASWWYSREHLYDRSDASPNVLADFAPFATFVSALTLNDGDYVDADADLSNANLRAVGQKKADRCHLWITNIAHTWKAVVDETSITPQGGDAEVSDLTDGTYTVTWINPYTGATIDVDQVDTAAGVLTLTLPSSISTDIAVTAELSAGGGPMAGAKSNYLEDALLDHVLGGGDYTRVATVYLALFTVDPSDAGGGTEVSGGSYARKAVTNNDTNFPAASGGAKALAVQTDFVEATGDWGEVTSFGLFDASSGGNLLYWATLTAPVTINTGEIARFAADALTFTED